MNFGSEERQALLTYLVIARNGLFKNLLEYLDAKGSCRLQEELERMSYLPFIKVRDISVPASSQEERTIQRTYFLHDEMYAICDRVGLIRPEEIRKNSERIVAWYDVQIEQYLEQTKARGYPDAVIDMMIESLPSRMRKDPTNGYQWYLEQSNLAITSGERELELRIRDAMAQFIHSADDTEEAGELPANAIDRQILISVAPTIYEAFKIDSALQWIMRYSVRGKHEKALDLVKTATWVKEGYERNPERHIIPYAEMRLWQGQSTMYMGHPEQVLIIYDEGLADIEKMYSPESIKEKIESNSIRKFNFNRHHRGYIG